MIDRREKDKTQPQKKLVAKGSFWNLYFKAGVIGLIIGIMILALLVGFDSEFAHFLNISNWYKILLNSFYSIIFYWLVFFWFFILPQSYKWRSEDRKLNLSSLLQAAVIVIVAILVSYSLYDSFIILKMFKLLKLTFEGMGNNTRQHFIELVILGGVLLSVVAFISSKIQEYWHEQKSKVTVISFILLASLVFLLPPLFNVIRALLFVYISEFGLTSTRLVGLYTVVAFLVALLVLLIFYIKKNSLLFSATILSFGVTLYFLIFVLPNNYLIMQDHFSRYLNKQEVDIEYLHRVNLGKWSFLLLDDLQPDKYFSDNLWGLLFATRSGDKKAENNYSNNILLKISEEKGNIQELLDQQDFQSIVDNYTDVQTDYSVYKGKKIKGLDIVFDTLESDRTYKDTFFKELKDDLKSINSFYVFKNMGNSHVSIKYVFRPNESDYYKQAYQIYLLPESPKKNYVSDVKTINIRLPYLRTDKQNLEIRSSLVPFWIEGYQDNCNQKKVYSCDSFFENLCGMYVERANQKLEYGIIPEELVPLYFVSLTSGPNCPVFILK